MDNEHAQLFEEICESRRLLARRLTIPPVWYVTCALCMAVTVTAALFIPSPAVAPLFFAYLAAWVIMFFGVLDAAGVRPQFSPSISYLLVSFSILVVPPLLSSSFRQASGETRAVIAACVAVATGALVTITGRWRNRLMQESVLLTPPQAFGNE